MKTAFRTPSFPPCLTAAIFALHSLTTSASAAVVMIDFGTTSSAVADAADLGIDNVSSKSEVDANGGAFNVSVGTETLTVDLIDHEGDFISRDRGTSFFTDNSPSDILTPYVRDNVLASDSDMDITIGGLTIGHTYAFGFYSVDLYSVNGAQNTMTIVGDATFGTVGSLLWKNGDAATTTYTTLATNVISTGNFVAGAASETFTITGGISAPRGTIQALTIYAIPEPTTFALVGLALGAMFLFRRRR